MLLSNQGVETYKSLHPLMCSNLDGCTTLKTSCFVLSLQHIIPILVFQEKGYGQCSDLALCEASEAR